MIRRGLFILLAMIVLVLLLASEARGQDGGLPERKAVLVLNSYHWGFPWTDAQVEGIMQVLRGSTAEPEVFLEHMDALRQRATMDDRFLVDYLRRRFGSLQFDLVITTDDAALAFAVRNHTELFPLASIVFSDALDFDAAAVFPDIPVTGVRESEDMAGTLRAARQLLPDAKRIVVFGNRHDPATGFTHAREALLQIAGPLPVEQHLDLSVEQILAAVGQLSATDIVIPMASAVDASGRLHDHAALIPMIAALSPVPVFDIMSQRVRSGITLGGSVKDGVAQGRAAAAMGLRILAGTRASDIPVADSAHLLMFSYPVMQRFGIPESRLPEGSILVGKPPGLYEQYRGLVLATVFALLALVGVIGMLMINIRHRRRAEAIIEQSEERLRLALEGATDGIWDWNLQTGSIFVNSRYYTMLGFEPGEFPLGYEVWRGQVHPDDVDDVEQRLQAHFAEGQGRFHAEFRMRAKDGGWRWILSRGCVVERDTGGAPLRVAGSHADISDSKFAEQRIAAALVEKEVLLKEIYHRVKNNLQVVASLLSMQGRSVEDKGVQALFEESAARVMAMSQIHEQLYESSDLASIDFKHYLGQLLARLVAQHGLQGVRIEAALDDVVLGIETAIPCALIVNELVSNSVKHAFPAGRSGCVRIGLTAEPDDGVRLSVADDGVGLPPGFVPEHSRSLGWRLVVGLANQIGGRLGIDGGGAGTRVTLHFQSTRRESRRYAEALPASERSAVVA